MIMIEFRKEDHEKNMSLVHRIKEDVCELWKNLEAADAAHGERHYEIDSYDERRGMMGRRDIHEEMDERRGRMGRYVRRDDRYENKHYPEYPFDERGGGRYNY